MSTRERLYRTRAVVRQPLDPRRWNGSAVVEWNNVSGGLDVAPDWDYVHRHLIREGFAWVGVSAQQAGIEGGGLGSFSFPFQVRRTRPSRIKKRSVLFAARTLAPFWRSTLRR